MMAWSNSADPFGEFFDLSPTGLPGYCGGQTVSGVSRDVQVVLKEPLDGEKRLMIPCSRWNPF